MIIDFQHHYTPPALLRHPKVAGMAINKAGKVPPYYMPPALTDISEQLRAMDAGASICVAQGTTTELNLADYFRTHALKYEGIAFGNLDEASKGLETGRCDAFTTDSSGLAAQRLTFGVPDDFVILPQII